MNMTPTKDLEALVAEKVRSGRYADASYVVRDTLRALKERDGAKLEAALLEGVRSPHRVYGPATLAEVRKAAGNP